MRALALLIALGGCDLVFQIHRPPDAAVPEPDASDPADVGCADGSREGFDDLARWPAIAGCGGGWSLAGVAAQVGPACGRAAGDDSANPTGAACNAEDLCAAGWHVCVSTDDVALSSPTGCAEVSMFANLFFATRQSGPGNLTCTAGGIDDLFGCGTQGIAITSSTCKPLDRGSGDVCGALQVGGWSCSDQFAEARTVTKADAGGGGVLCCHD